MGTQALHSKPIRQSVRLRHQSDSEFDLDKLNDSIGSTQTAEELFNDIIEEVSPSQQNISYIYPETPFMPELNYQNASLSTPRMNRQKKSINMKSSIDLEEYYTPRKNYKVEA